MREFIENEFLVPSLAIGVPESIFWEKTPRTLAIYFKAFAKKQEQEQKRWSQQMWEMGLYVKAALSTSIVVAGLYDGKHKLPKYPDCPHIKEENSSSNLTEEQIKAERLRCYYYFKSLGKNK